MLLPFLPKSLCICLNKFSRGYSKMYWSRQMESKSCNTSLNKCDFEFSCLMRVEFLKFTQPVVNGLTCPVWEHDGMSSQKDYHHPIVTTSNSQAICLKHLLFQQMILFVKFFCLFLPLWKMGMILLVKTPNLPQRKKRTISIVSERPCFINNYWFHAPIT